MLAAVEIPELVDGGKVNLKRDHNRWIKVTIDVDSELGKRKKGDLKT